MVDVLTSISILIGSGVAIYSIDAWRREHVGRRRVELAEDTLALFYEASDAIRDIRNPGSFGHEYQDVERGENETDAQFEARRRASVMFYRYNQHSDLFSKIHASRYRVMAQINRHAAEPFDDLRNIINRMILSARMLSQYWARDHFRTEQQADEHWARVQRHEEIFWDSGEDDQINPELDQIIVSIEQTCRPIIDGPRTLRAVVTELIGKVSAWRNRQS